MEGVADTSIFVSLENGAHLPDVSVELAVSVMTIAELHIGVLLATTPEDRARRLQTAADVESRFEPLPVTLDVARRYATLGDAARLAGRKPKVIDLLIAATASVQGLPVYTRDRDFERIPGVDVRLL